MIRAFFRNSIYYVLASLLTIVSCNSETANNFNCQQTKEAFVTYFNASEFEKMPEIFQKGAKTKAQFKKLAHDLTYIKSVIGDIESMEVAVEEGNKTQYITKHEIAATDISFLFDDHCQLKSLLIKNHFPENLPQLERNITSMILPFHDQWYVFWGGSTVEQNYHNSHQNMKGAFDFLVQDAQGKSYRTDGKKNEDYYAFGKEIISPCDAKVVKVITGVNDNIWPSMNQIQSYGNTVVLETAQKEFLLFAHMKEHSIIVKEGQQVSQGEKLGLCGNSGYSTEPHLHFIVQNVADLFHPTGASCYFDNILVNGRLKQDYSPVRGELIKNN